MSNDIATNTANTKTAKVKNNFKNNAQTDTPKTDIYANITNQIVEALEQNVLPWRQPWSVGHLAGNVQRPLRWNDLPYSGINTLVLWMTASAKGYNSPYWMTYKQAVELKGQVRKGEKSATVVYADTFSREEENDKGEKEKKDIPFLKGYSVFNADQIEGLAPAFYTKPEMPLLNPEQKSTELEAFFTATKANITIGKRASYSTTSDTITMPPFECFESAKSYYAILAHELTHWTGHASRLNRPMLAQFKDQESYAKEELVAELSACFLAADLGLEPKPADDHAGYIAFWLDVLKNDKRFIFSAASHAQKAVEFVHKLQI